MDAVDIVIAAPVNDLPTLRSGTWATVRYTRQVSRPVIDLLRESPDVDDVG